MFGYIHSSMVQQLIEEHQRQIVQARMDVVAARREVKDLTDRIIEILRPSPPVPAAPVEPAPLLPVEIQAVIESLGLRGGLAEKMQEWAWRQLGKDVPVEEVARRLREGGGL